MSARRDAQHVPRPHVDCPSALPRRRRPPLVPVQRREPGVAKCGRCGVVRTGLVQFKGRMVCPGGCA